MKTPHLLWLLFTLFFSSPILAQENTAACLNCHAQKISTPSYYASVHKSLACSACHIKDEAANTRTKCVATFKKPTTCLPCHTSIVNEHAESVHNSKRLPTSCSKCHSEIHSITSHKSDKLAIAHLCAQCHKQQQSYFESVHHKALLAGHTDAATCTDCHGLHAIAKVDNRSKGRLFHTKACLVCHGNEQTMARNHVTRIAPNTYFESYHGKNVRLGYPERVAGCADCHSSHAILKASDAKSSVNAANVVKTCAQCHTHATASFAKFLPHAEITGAHKSTFLYWTFVAMTTLLAGTFLFFWVHSLLWAIRAFVEKRKHARLPSVEIKDGKKIYRRFRPLHIALHILVVTSFLGLALTGLPLKFSETPWGKTLVDLLGGTATAGTIHRTCAVLTFTYFFIAIALSIHFLFVDKKQNGTWKEKLLGPDSLCPNWRDLKDLKAMFKWFIFKGPKPSFDRWTYWEKFDFLAVFWGMFAIGLSGLMLWFPVFFSHIVPGWFFNVATLVHSDEALLATGFIFTVHFFNTHFRPEKFPMDFVIFNGEITKAEMIEERADQWKRYETTGVTENFAVNKPSSLVWDFLLTVFGYTAVLIGLGLTAAMIYALASHLI